MSDNPFEITQPMRELAEQNMKQAHAAYEQLADFMTKTMGTWMGAMPSNPMAVGFKDLQDRAMDFAKDNAELAFSFASKICNAQTPQEILQIQTQFAQDRMQALVTHTQELCGLMGDAFQKVQRS